MSVVPRSVVITGANRGIGLELVRQLLTLTPTPVVIATARDPSKATQLQQLVTSHPNHVHVLELEMTDYDDYSAIAGQVQTILGPRGGLDLLVNNAGVYLPKTLDNLTHGDMMSVYKINSVAPLLFTRAMLPVLKLSSAHRPANTAPQRTLVVNMSSSFGSIAGLAEGSAYEHRPSKTALNIFTRCLSIDLRPFGIQVLSINPGWVQTDMGGIGALITSQQSVDAMLTKVILNAGLELNGKFYSYDGSRLEW